LPELSIPYAVAVEKYPYFQVIPPITNVGELLVKVFPNPSCPLLLLPHSHIVPSALIPPLCAKPVTKTTKVCPPTIKTGELVFVIVL